MKTKKIQKKYIIKILKNNNTISFIYSKQNKLIIFIELLNKQKKYLLLKTQLFWISKFRFLIVSTIPFLKISSNEKKNLKIYQGTILALIKYIEIELTINFFCKKMKFIGVGYRAFQLDIKKKKLLRLRLGYSHQIYFYFLNNINFFCLKFTKLFIFGNSYQNTTQFCALIRSCKPPEPYKGKGILYKNEKILLKIGKKV